MHHLANHDVFGDALDEFHRVLKPGGVLHLATQSQTGEADSATVTDELVSHNRFYIYFTMDRLEALLKKKGFRLSSMDEFKETDNEVNAGRAKVGWLVALAVRV